MAKVKDDNKPRGRISSYAFFVQKCREDAKKKNQAINFAEFSRKCSEQWKKMSETEKKKFVQMADKDKKRFTSEMASYVPPKGAGKGKGKKGKKDPNAPKRALSAFFLYCNDERPKVKATLPPEATVGDVAKELGKRWALIKPAERAKYDAAAEKEKLRYGKALAVYKAEGGGGSSSSGGRKVKSKKQVESSAEESEEEAEDDDDDEDEDDDEDDDE